MSTFYRRIAAVPRGSFFLFGPRGVGKSTWVRERLPNARRFDLLDETYYQELLGDPSVLASELRTLKAGELVVVDGVQRFPGLLNEVHRFIEEKRLKFALLDSSRGSRAKPARLREVSSAGGLVSRADRQRFCHRPWRGHGEDHRRRLSGDSRGYALDVSTARFTRRSCGSGRGSTRNSFGSIRVWLGQCEGRWAPRQAKSAGAFWRGPS